MLEYLNDDCLAEIFQYLSVKDQLIMTIVNERFCTIIIERFWRFEFSIFTARTLTMQCSELNLAEFEMFYRLIAPHITLLQLLDITSTAFTSYLGRYAKRPNLDFYLHHEYPELLMLYCKDEHLYNGHLKMIARKCSKLEALKLISPYVTGQYIEDVKNLRQLSMHSMRLEPLHIEKILKNQKIVLLELSGQTTNEREMTKILREYLPKVTELHYYDDRDELLVSSDFVFCTNSASLKSLELLFCKNFPKFALTNTPPLSTLHEVYFESHVTVNDLLKLVENNVNLVNLCLGQKFSVNSTKSEWVCELADLVRAQQEKGVRKQILTIYMDNGCMRTWQAEYMLEKYNLRYRYLEPAIKIKTTMAGEMADLEFPGIKAGIQLVLKWN